MKALAISFLIYMSFSYCQAGFFVEPGIATVTSESKGKLINGTEFKTKSKGNGAILRLGYQFGMPFVALEGTYLKGKTDANPESDVENKGSGIVVGLGSIPIVRPYVGYAFSVKTDVKDSVGTTTQYRGESYKFGLGVKVLASLYLDLSYSQLSYYETSLGYFNSFFDEFKATSTIIGISYVF